MKPVTKKWISRAVILLAIAGIALATFILGKVAQASHEESGFAIEGPVAGTLNILSPHHEGIRLEFARAFNSWREKHGKKPVKCEWLDVGGTSDILKYIRSTFKSTPGGIDIDMFFGGGLDPYVALEEEGLLEKCPIPPGILTNIPLTLHGVPLYSENGYWYGAALSGFGILYNKVVLEKFDLPIPHTWEDLTDPRLRTWVGSADMRKSGSTHMMYEIILQAYGWEKGMHIISALAGNVRSFTQSASTVPKDIAVGEVAAGLCIDVYAWSTMEKVGGDRLGFVLPEGLTVVNPDAIAILKGAPEKELAIEFLTFVLSEAGQKIWMLEKGSIEGAPVEYQLNKMPVWPSLYAKYDEYTYFSGSPFEWKKTVKYDSAKGSARWGILNSYLGTLFIDAHPSCKKAWGKICTGNLPEKYVEMYYADPLTETEILSYATNEFKDTEWKARIVTDWANDARKRYHTIISQ